MEKFERLTWDKKEREKFIEVCGGFDGMPMSNEIYTRLAGYEDTSLSPERVAELALAEKEERLLIIPCKPKNIKNKYNFHPEEYEHRGRGFIPEKRCLKRIIIEI